TARRFPAPGRRYLDTRETSREDTTAATSRAAAPRRQTSGRIRDLAAAWSADAANSFSVPVRLSNPKPGTAPIQQLFLFRLVVSHRPTVIALSAPPPAAPSATPPPPLRRRAPRSDGHALPP